MFVFNDFTSDILCDSMMLYHILGEIYTFEFDELTNSNRNWVINRMPPLHVHCFFIHRSEICYDSNVDLPMIARYPIFNSLKLLINSALAGVTALS